MSDIFVDMKAVTKRQFMRKPSVLSGLQPGQSIVLKGKPSLVVSRPKERRMTIEEIEAEIDQLGEGCPKIDTLAVLKDLRQ